MVDQLIALGVTLAATFGLLPILTPWFQGGGQLLRQGWQHLLHASRNSLVVWTRNANVASALYLGVVLGYLVYLFFTTNADLPWWGWVAFVAAIVMMVARRVFDQFVNAAGTGLRGSVIRTLATSYGGVFAAAWVLMLVGFDLNEQLVHAHTHRPGVSLTPANLEVIRDWALDRAHRIGAIALFTATIQVELAYFAFDWTAAGIRILSIIEFLLRRGLNGYIAGLDVSRTLAQIEADNEKQYKDGNMPTFKLFIVNSLDRVPVIIALFLLDRLLVFVWMSYMVAWKISLGMLVGGAGYLVLYGISKSGLNRVTAAPRWTYLPFIPAGIWIGYWLIVGPYRQSLGEVPFFHTVGTVLWRLTHLPPITAFLFLIGFGLAVAASVWAGSWLVEKTGATRTWIKAGVLAASGLIPVLVVGSQLVGLAATDINTPNVAFTRHWSAAAAWDTGAPFVVILVAFVAIYSVAGWRMAKEGEKLARIVAIPMLSAAAFFLVIGISAGYVVDAPLGATTGVYVLGNSGDTNCTQAWQTPNGPSQCCAGTAYQPPPRSMCVPYGQ